MTQQINLFNPLFLKQRKYFSALTMLEGLGIVILGMAAFYAWQYYQQVSLDSQIGESEQAFQKQKQSLTELTATLPPGQADQADGEIADLEGQIAGRQRVLGELQSADAGSSGNYAGYLAALSRQMVNGVWITWVHISDAGSDLIVNGRATQPDLVPELVRRLNAESLLRGRQFESLGIKRVVPGQGGGAAPGQGGGAAADAAAAPAGPGAVAGLGALPFAGLGALSGLGAINGVDAPPATPSADGSAKHGAMPPYVEFSLATHYRDIDLVDKGADAPAGGARQQAPALPQAADGLVHQLLGTPVPPASPPAGAAAPRQGP